MNKITANCNNCNMINFEQDRKKLSLAFNGSKDIIMLDTTAFSRAAVICFVDGMTDRELIDRNVIEPLKRSDMEFSPHQSTRFDSTIKNIDCLDITGILDNDNNSSAPAACGDDRGKQPVICPAPAPPQSAVITADMINKVIFISDPIIVCDSFDDMVQRIASGDIGLMISGAEDYFVLSLRDYKIRGITEPPVSTVLRGPREGFVEDLKINMTMLRRRFKSPNLVFDMLEVGRYSGTNIAVAYVNGVADDNIVRQIKARISAIDCDGIVDSSYIARYIEDNQHSLFNQVGMAEKPDIIAGKLLEGRVAIICDGSPTVLTLPFVLFEHFQSNEDYYIKSYRASVTRVLRVVAMIIAICLPAAYVALQEFQYHMFPLKLLVVIMNSLQGVPLTPTIEMLVLLLVFEILNEASIRMPRYVGTALSIVGAIVLGESAVSAGLLSVPTLLVTAMSTIGLYCVPDEVDAGSVLRIVFVAVTGITGIFGLILAVFVLFAYMVGLRNYGTSYMAPFSPMLISDFKDGIIKENLIDMKKRPYSIPTTNRTRSK